MSIPHFCRNILFWTILVKICSLRCTANWELKPCDSTAACKCYVQRIAIRKSWKRDVQSEMFLFFSVFCACFVQNLDLSLITQHIHAHASMGTQEYRGIGEVKITFFIEDHVVTYRCLFFMGLSLGRWAVVSLSFSYIYIMTLPLRWRVHNASVTLSSVTFFLDNYTV